MVFLKGFLIGLSIAAPVGPIGVLCIRRTLADGRAVGLASGLGAATADALYGLLAAFGVTFVTNALIQQQLFIRLVGGLFLCYLGARTFFSRPAPQTAVPGGRGLLSAFGSTFVLTVSNPLTIMSFAAIFSGIGISAQSNYREAGVLVGGVFSGSAAWWLMLTATVGVISARIEGGVLRWVNRLSGAIIAAFGVAALVAAMA